jgi:hypothetical protein
MRRAHRRAHLVLWCVIASALLAGLLLALAARPGDPTTVIPEAIAGEAP